MSGQTSTFTVSEAFIRLTRRRIFVLSVCAAIAGTGFLFASGTFSGDPAFSPTEAIVFPLAFAPVMFLIVYIPGLVVNRRLYGKMKLHVDSDGFVHDFGKLSSTVAWGDITKLRLVESRRGETLFIVIWRAQGRLVQLVGFESVAEIFELLRKNAGPATTVETKRRGVDFQRPPIMAAALIGGALALLLAGWIVLEMMRQDTLTPFIMLAVFLFWFLSGSVSLVLYGRDAARRKRAASSKPDGAKALGRGRRQLILAAFFAIVGGIGLTQTRLEFGWGVNAGGGPAESSDAALYAAAAEHIEPLLEKSGGVGAAVALVSGGRHGIFGFGAAGVGDDVPPDGDTIFEIGSITKTFTGILLAEAIERGEVELAQRIEELVPEASGIPAVREGTAITLRHLTTHTAGFPRMPPGFFNPSRFFKMFFGGDPYRDYTFDEMAQALNNLELASEPGTHSDYSNFGAGLLGVALSRRANTSYDDLVQSRICRPLGMVDTAGALNDEQSERLAAGYDGRLRLGPLVVALGAANWELAEPFAGAGVLRSSANDMLRFLLANMGRAESELDSALRRAQGEQFREDDRHAVGMGWLLADWQGWDANVLWHNGETGGYRSFIAFTEDGKFGVVILANSTTNYDSTGFDILKSLIAGGDSGGGRVVPSSPSNEEN